MKNHRLAFSCGLLFAWGLAIAGMLKPEKIIGFLDFFGQWDPSLMFVMAGALSLNGLTYAFVKKWKRPIFGKQFNLPTNKVIDIKLIFGSALFGIGWGLSGLCPGPGLASATTGQPVLFFLGAMFIGMLTFKWTRGKQSS